MDDNLLKDYRDILDLASLVCNELKGRTTSIPKMASCQRLAFKLIFHAATIYHLRNGTKIQELTIPFDFFDQMSTMALTRVTLENYIRLYEIFFMPKNDDERIFIHSLWELSGFVIRECIDNKYVSEEIVEKGLQDIEEIRKELGQTSEYQSLSDKEKKQINKGKKPNRFGWKTVAENAGIASETFFNTYQLLNSYVHSDGLSGAQLIAADTSDKQIEYIDMCMSLVMGVLSKMIHNYAETFPPSRVVCDNNPELFNKAEIWAGFLERMT